MVSPATVDRQARSGVVIWSFVAVVMSMTGRQTLAQDGHEWAGKRVVAKLGAVFRADEAKVADIARGNSKSLGRTYRVEKVDGSWLSLVDEETGAACRATAESVVPFDQAVDYFTSELRGSPKSAAAYVGRGRVWSEKREFDKAIADCGEAIRLDPADALAYSIRASVWFDKKEYDKAIDDYGEAIRLDSSDAASYNNRGAALFVRGKIDRSIADYSEAIRRHPKYASAYFNRALAWRAVKEYDQAIADDTEAIQLDSKDASAYFSRGNAWSDKRDFDKAIADYNEAVRLNPKGACAYYNRALAWRARSDWDKAIADYSEAIRLDPDDAAAYFNRAFAWRAKNALDKAIADFSAAIRVDPRHTFSYFNRGLMLEHANELDKAIADFNEAIRLDPNDGMAFAQRAKTWARKQQYDKAITDFDEAVRLEPWQPLVQFHRGFSQLIMHRREAAATFEKVLELEAGKGHHSAYAVIFGHFAARLTGDDAQAGEFLEVASEMLNRDAWPYPAVKLLRGEISEGAFLAAATDNDKRTEARCYLGFDHLLKGQKGLALDHFRWVRNHGNREFFEYKLAVAEIERLEKPNAKSPAADRGGR